MYRYNRVFEIGQTRQSYGAEFHKFRHFLRLVCPTIRLVFHFMCWTNVNNDTF